MRWSGGNNSPQKEIDVLVRSSHLQALVDDIVGSGEWKVSRNYVDIKDWLLYDSMVNETPIRDVWLKACFLDPAFEYLRFWPEELYHLTVDCNKVEVPDVSIRNYVVLEEEYYRDPCQRFGPPLLRRYEECNIPLLPPIQQRAKIMRRDIPIFIPTIEDHINALLDQTREQRKSERRNGGDPEGQIRNYIRYLYLDWIPTRNWLLSTKIRERNLELMTQKLDKYQRKPIVQLDPITKKAYHIMPWERPIRPEFLHLAEQIIDSGPSYASCYPKFPNPDRSKAIVNFGKSTQDI
jgi:hypothetical protein